MKRLEGLKSKVGTAVALLVVGALGFAQFVLPLLRDNSETSTCDSKELQGFCDEPGTIANFFASVCGRAEVRFTGSFMRELHLGGVEPPVENVGTTLRVACGSHDYLAADFNRGEEAKSAEDFKAHVTKGKDTFDLYERWARGQLTLDEARRLMLAK